jgi:4'-phosphopantetheinyl transferase EntD
MTTAKDQQLQRSIDTLAIPGVLIGHRVISQGDEQALLPEECEAFASSVLQVRRASGAARIVARELLQRVGISRAAVPKSKSGMPLWPNGIVGSLAHGSQFAVAAIAMRRDYRSLGIDIEPADVLDPDLLELVATPTERQFIDRDPYRGRVLFAAKEAVYKSVYPLDQTFLNHHDVKIDLPACIATVCSGRTVEFRYCLSPQIVVLAYISASRGP